MILVKLHYEQKLFLKLRLTKTAAFLGIPNELQSCHTGTIDGYVFEGHVPAATIGRFLAAPPEGAYGLSVPGMPIGSPGMEMGERLDPYAVILLSKDGQHRVYERITELQP